IDNDVAVDPVDARDLRLRTEAAARRDVVGERAAHPHLDREVAGADVRGNRRIDAHLDAVDAGVAAGAVEADGTRRERVGGPDPEQHKGHHGPPPTFHRVLGGRASTTGQDRFYPGYDETRSTLLAQMPTLRASKIR